MTRWSKEPLEDREHPDQEDLADDLAVVPCPHCGAPIEEDVEKCPHCRQWILEDLHPWRPANPWPLRVGRWLAQTLLLNWLAWIVIGAMLLLAFWVSLFRK